MSSDTASSAAATSSDTTASADTRTAALERTLAETLDVFGGLTADELSTPSACDGWTVHTTLAHLTISVAGFAGLIPITPYDQGLEFEAAVDAHTHQVAARRTEELLDIIRSSVPAVLATFGRLTDELATMPVNMGTAGSYPLASIADAIVFDHTCHTRWDILTPRGPIQRTLPDLDGDRLAAANRWLIGGIRQMTTEQFRELLTDPLALVLTGAGGAAFRLLPHATSVENHDDVPAAQNGARATVHTSTTDFILWGTGREPRHNRIEITGDTAYANTVLDAFRVY
ncbi:maleylpyruvate isomerase N-terminal domain-containing protein [Frankia sp. CNm7]|uniref:Maleylpyruvate isomerase N-terminal domain-containing protein n=1 Tax=Frankia nepalensis TaxID=1836974 RepID=A0A937RGL5_9ACTN|nr:maleylpyruvate isomerase N-terminal domain-containing protein [Frankia nepalensis]MBL7495754.1 maleylpyruvate isomerase N-terminal domain-containing protein [Frankia nepalensis]MBL7509028.1 maleylpyruvate isomerase N-terminal domain-containing protein [Frankia nepalensis]MBL7523461.1 maleylpyruvate isomerase N-terminal domain-containing protein [Frankia nepalensis]MBL7629827.1 maleylpyruvate isomerase N-terminal domain-containing protein [Frankia nepalensis]